MGNGQGKDGNRVEALEIIKKESIPEDTVIYRVDDGTIFYYKWTTPQRLYMKNKNIETDAMLLPVGNIAIKGVFGNALYFASQGHIYQATPTATGVIDITLMRRKLSGENLFRGGVCSRFRDAHNYIYRIHEDPNKDGIRINISDEQLAWVTRTCHIHRETVLFLQISNVKSSHSVRRLSKNVVVAEAPMFADSFAPDDACPFIYFAHEQYLYILDTETLEFLPCLKIKKVDEICSIAGVHDRIITLGVRSGSDCYMITAQLPVGYFEKNSTFYREGLSVQQAKKKNTEAEFVLNDVLERDSKKKVKQSVKKKNEQSPSDIPHCVICLDNLPKIIFHDCMHLIVCEDCFNPAVITSCPNCRKVIRSSAKVYF